MRIDILVNGKKIGEYPLDGMEVNNQELTWQENVDHREATVKAAITDWEKNNHLYLKEVRNQRKRLFYRIVITSNLRMKRNRPFFDLNINEVIARRA